MTGSGKTGLCIVLLEEAALKGIPAIIIDPKGDLTNLLLHFPELAPQDFQPWIDADLARRAGKSVEQVAADASNSWREGLIEWLAGTYPGVEECGTVCDLYARFRCRHPCQRFVFTCCARNTVERKPRGPARKDHQHGHGFARTGGL
jgi:hypothetical protein